MQSNSLRVCACGHGYEAHEWSALPLFARLDAAGVSSIVTQWPSHLVVEVRVCASCQRKIPRLRDGRPADVVAAREAVAA